MGERSAVRPKSGQSVSQSDPGLRRPTPPSTAGRKPAARPPFQVSHHAMQVPQRPAKRALLSLKLAGVRDRVPPYRSSAQRWARAIKSPKPKRLLYPPSTNHKLKHWPSSSRFSTAGTGRHMESNPCKPSSVAAVPPHYAIQASFEIFPTHPKPFAFSFLAGGFPCHSEPLCPTQVPKPLQSTAIAFAIAILNRQLPAYPVQPVANCGRGPPGRLRRPELQALSNSLQLT